MSIPRQIPPPPTLASDWLPDYQRQSARVYRPRALVRKAKPGRPRGGRHSERRRTQWRAAKQRMTETQPHTRTP